jgi:hypothetical protein
MYFLLSTSCGRKDQNKVVEALDPGLETQSFGKDLNDLRNTVEAVKFCIFGNYCDKTGRHYPARYSVSVWNYANGKRGINLVTNVTNEVALNDAGDYAGTVACVTLPDSDGQDEYYFEITLLNSNAYSDVEEEIIRSGVITDTDVKALYDGATNVDYYHFRAGCQEEDTPSLF